MEHIITGIIYVIIGAVGIAVGYLMPKVNSTLTALSSNAVLKTWAVYLIKYAQEFIAKEGKIKMDWVVSQLAQLCRKSKVNITDEQLRVLSEGVYNEISKEVKKIKYEGN